MKLQNLSRALPEGLIEPAHAKKDSKENSRV
jgi:hypothetical protein